MSADDHRTCPFRDEMAAIVSSARPSAGSKARETAFAALVRLERLALVGGASEAALREIAEARFLTGILRDSVRASRPAPLRSILRAAAIGA